MRIGSRRATGRNRAWGGYETAYNSDIQIRRGVGNRLSVWHRNDGCGAGAARHLLVKAWGTSAFCWLEAYNITALPVYVRCISLNAWVFALDLAQCITWRRRICNTPWVSCNDR